MIDIKAGFEGGMNLDDSPYMIPGNAYPLAYNISRDAIEADSDRVISNIVGNTLVDYSLPAGDNAVIGTYSNTVRNSIIYFVWNSNGYHLILEYYNPLKIIVPIFESKTDSGGIDILNFDRYKLITSINVYNRDEGDLLFFIDSLRRPTGIDIEKMKQKDYVPVTRDIIDVCKRPPLSPPYVVYQNDTNFLTNNLRGQFFRFKYRYVYDDLSKSVCSPISKVPIPANILDTEYTDIITNNNLIQVNLNTGDKDVKKVELLMSYVNKTNNWSDFALVETLDKEITYGSYSFIENVVGTDIQVTRITFNGTPIPGAIVSIYYTLQTVPTPPPYLAASYTVLFGDTIDDIVAGLAASSTIAGTTATNNVLTISCDPLNDGLFTNVEILYANGTDNLDIAYNFYNDSTYPYIDINESILLYDTVPDKANAQELANGNVLIYGGITEGYNRDLQTSVEINIDTTPKAGAGTGDLAISQSNTYANEIKYKVYGNPPAGTLIEVHLIQNPGNIPITVSTYITVDGDTAANIAENLANNATGLYYGFYAPSSNPPTFYIGINYPGVTIKPDYIKIKYPNTNNPAATFLFSSKRNLGIAYFDKKGKTNGILYNSLLSFPSYAENVSNEVLLPYINCKVYHQPPTWANSFQFYLTKENTQFLYWVTFAYTDAEDVYFDITNIYTQQTQYPTTANVIGWSFNEGDRLRLIRNQITKEVFDYTYDTFIEGIIKDPVINGQTINGVTVAKIKKTGSFVHPDSWYRFQSVTNPNVIDNYFVIQLYRPDQSIPNNENQTYYEFSEQYYVINPGESNRAHSGMVSDQNISTGVPAEFNFYNGDVYFRPRTSPLKSVSSVNFNTIYDVLDRNITDNYTSAVNSIDGRPNIIDINAKESYYSTMVRFGQAYQPDTNINGLPRFYPNNFDQYDYTFGDIMRFKTRDRFIRVFQKLKVGKVPLYNQILKENVKENLVVTDRLLNPIIYYVGDVGIGNLPESLASHNYADYFCSDIRGTICRINESGVEFLSIDKKINSWANLILPVRTTEQESKVVGAFDNKLSNYVVAISQVPGSTEYEKGAFTIVFDEEYGNFDSFYTYYPEMMGTLGTLFVSYKDGAFYSHDSTTYNEFYGNPVGSQITTIFNKGGYQKKTFLAMSQIATVPWVANSITTDLGQTSSLIDSDFAQLEGTYEATFLRDASSPGGLLEGDSLKGKYIKTNLVVSNPTTLTKLNMVSLKYIDSPLTNR